MLHSDLQLYVDKHTYLIILIIQVKNILLLRFFLFFIGFFIGFFIILNISLPSVNAETCPNNPADNPCWVIKNPMPTARRALGVATNLDGEIYAVGGYDGQGGFLNVLEKYSPETDTWSTEAPMPEGRNAMGFAFSPSTGKFYVAGGYNQGFFNNLYEYDPSTNSWDTKEPMPTSRIALGLIAANGKLYAIGGLLADNTCVSTVEEYSPAINSWTSKAPMPTPRCGIGVVSVNGKIYAIGGLLDITENHNESSAVEEFDPTTNTWTEKTPLTIARSYPAVSVNSLGNIYVIGGNIKDPAEVPVILTDTVEEYNPINNSLSTKTSFPISTFQLGAALGINNKVYVIGGQTMDAEAVNTVYEGFIPTPPSITLNVPLFKQTDPLWKNQTYDNAQIWSPQLKTIERWGCVLTSAAMILKFHGINKLPNGSNLNPGTLNSWLKNQKDGYVGTGWVNWLAISRLSKLAKQINGITAFDALEYSRINGENKNKLKEDIEASIPDILEEPGHFVVAKGFNNDTFKINDPFYDRNTLNDGYSNTFLSLNRFLPSNTDLSYIMISVSPEVDIVLKDQNGNNVGESFIQQPLVDDLNPSNTNSPIQILYLPKPLTGNYQLSISSTNNKQYYLNVFLYDKNGNVNTLTQSGMVGSNISNTFNITFNKEDSNSSRSIKTVTFQTFIDDVTLAKNLKLINSTVAQSLIKLAKSAQNNFEKNRKLVAKLELIAIENIIKPLKNTLIKEPAYSILLYDVKYLRNNL